MEINWSIVSWIGIPVIKPIEDAMPLILNLSTQQHQNVKRQDQEATPGGGNTMNLSRLNNPRFCYLRPIGP